MSAQRAYLNKANALVEDYVAALGERKTELSDPAMSMMHHEALEKRFAQGFPDYALPYMVKYSIYGLLATKLESNADQVGYFIPATSAAGALIGYRLSPKFPQPYLQRLGLLPSDIITAVHGIPLVHRRNLAPILERLKSGDFASVTFIREGNQLVTTTIIPDTTFQESK